MGSSIVIEKDLQPLGKFNRVFESVTVVINVL